MLIVIDEKVVREVTVRVRGVSAQQVIETEGEELPPSSPRPLAKTQAQARVVLLRAVGGVK